MLCVGCVGRSQGFRLSWESLCIVGDVLLHGWWLLVVDRCCATASPRRCLLERNQHQDEPVGLREDTQRLSEHGTLRPVMVCRLHGVSPPRGCRQHSMVDSIRCTPCESRPAIATSVLPSERRLGKLDAARRRWHPTRRPRRACRTHGQLQFARPLGIDHHDRSRLAELAAVSKPSTMSQPP